MLAKLLSEIRYLYEGLNCEYCYKYYLYLVCTYGDGDIHTYIALVRQGDGEGNDSDTKKLCLTPL
jgi:hypothetical protein